MARPKVVRTKEEAAGVDPSLPIQVEIAEGGAVEVPKPSSGNGTVSAGPQPPAPPPAPPRDDGELSSLRAQIETMKKNAEEQTRQIAEAQRREAEMRQQHEAQNRQSQNAMQQAFNAQVDAVTNAEAAATQALEGAKSAAAIAYQTQDWQALSEANDRATEARIRLVQLQDAKANLNERAERAKAAPQQPPNSLEAYIEQMPISWQQKDWFRKHPDVLNDRRKYATAQWAHFQALDKGYTQDSPDYFEAIDAAMGYRAVAPPKSEDIDDEPIAPAPQSVSAPVTRSDISAASGRPSTTRITLTAAQREAARDAGVDEVTYARGLLELERRKQAGHYNG